MGCCPSPRRVLRTRKPAIMALRCGRVIVRSGNIWLLPSFFVLGAQGKAAIACSFVGVFYGLWSNFQPGLGLIAGRNRSLTAFPDPKRQMLQAAAPVMMKDAHCQPTVGRRRDCVRVVGFCGRSNTRTKSANVAYWIPMPRTARSHEKPLRLRAHRTGQSKPQSPSFMSHPRARATVKMSLSPRPHMFMIIR